MKRVNLASAIKKYNEIMWNICYEHNTIGTILSEGTENWNLRDMVAECDYVLSTYYEDGHYNCELKHDDYSQWRKEVEYLTRFIKRYEPFIGDMTCVSGHCSQYD